MNNIEYASKASRTLPDLGLKYDGGTNIKLSKILNLSHMALGLASELGELVNCTGTELKLNVDKPNLKEELGDLYWYIANYCNIQNIAPPIGELDNTLPEDRCFELLISSVGELVDIVKKYLAYDREIEKSRELEIIYDVYSALNLFEKVYGLDGDEIRKININKLQVRYPEKFTNELALNRDLGAERKTLES